MRRRSIGRRGRRRRVRGRRRRRVFVSRYSRRIGRRK